MKKIFYVILICLLLFSQTKVFAVDVIIEDPTPDLQAPYIKIISVSSNELTPTTPITINAEISDELSGFNKGSITYRKPSNQIVTVPFAQNSQTGTYEAYMSVSDIDVPGEWKVADIFLQDNKDNSVHLSHLSTQSNGELIDFSGLNLNVSGVSTPMSTDKEAPILNSLSIKSQELSVNDSIEITADISDNESGVSMVKAYYKKPSGLSQTIYLYKDAVGTFTGTHSIGKYEESGEWILTSIYISDKEGNSKTYSDFIDKDGNLQSFENCKLTITGTTIDSEAPVLNEISVTSTKVSPNEKIEVRAKITDNESGVSYVKVNYRNPSGNTKYFYLYKTTTDNEYVGSMTISQYEERGDRVLTSVYLRDNVGNFNTITNYQNENNEEKSFNHCTVEVIGTTPDWEAPEFIGGKIGVSQISAEKAAVKLTIEVEDNLSGITYSTLNGSYRKPSGKIYSLNFIKQNNQYTATIYIDKYDELGEWALNNLSIRDAVGNYARPIKIGSSPLSEFNINVMGKITITPGTHNSIFFEAPEVLSSAQTYQLKPVLKSSNESVPDADVTNENLVKYTSTNPDLLNVSTTGLITIPESAGSGIVMLEVSYGELTRQVEIKINEGTIESVLQVTPLSTILHAGESQQLKVVEINDGARKDITSSSSGITYSSSNPSLVSVSSNGLIQAAIGEIKGTAEIIVNYNGLSTKTIVQISKPVVRELSISPREETLSLSNNRLQLVVKAFMTDGTTKDVSKGIEGTSYISSNPAIAQVSGDGLVTVPSDATSGEVTITAKNNGVYVRSKININVPELTEINVTPDEIGVYPGDTIQLNALGRWSNGVVKDITSGDEGTSYISSLSSRGSVNENGTVIIPEDASYGKLTITLVNKSVKAIAVLYVEKDPSNELVEIRAKTENSKLFRNESTQLSITGIYGDESEKDLTSGTEGTTYTSSVPSRAVVDENGTITVPADATYGSVTITVRNGSLYTRVVLTIEEDQSKVLKNLSATIEDPALYREEETQLAVSGLYGDESLKDLTLGTAGTTYTSSVPSRAMVDENGTITVPADATYGSVTITVRNGTLYTRVVLTIEEDQSKVLQTLSASIEDSALYRGEGTQLSVTGVYGDETIKDLTSGTEETTYTSSVPSRAMVDENGKVTVPADATYGSVTITVRNGTLYTRLVLTIEEDQSKVLKTLSASIEDSALYREEETQITVSGIFGDESEKDLTSGTEGTTYTSSVPSRAIVDENGKVTVPAGATYGNVTITIRNGKLYKRILLTIQ
ncbi:Ig-like domain-containing protein [Bacillus sp. Marseille-Q1617]|uniref:Ig-like domain-containing protein n=1 Tax=Bacillus sp. Marseille-Q1617 TaxID=2736887 RepID=UPI00158B3825|nr:Ig-like domain-containing protein [Bacillus sp. Marseille-Q1617]